ncbi:MAG: hypothetical protein IT431_09680 [Phycisphaerales bacterium]|nr:hypothetical protein [Phycisphaerales bacterium]
MSKALALRSMQLVGLCVAALTAPVSLAQSGDDSDPRDWMCQTVIADDFGYLYYGVTNGYSCSDLDLFPGNRVQWVPSGCWGVRTYGTHHGKENAENGTYCDISLRGLPDGCPPSGDELDWTKLLSQMDAGGLNIDLETGVTPPDLPPRSFIPALSSAPMVPAPGGSMTRPVARFSRPMLADAVDLVSGIPMVQETDLELPFGTALFRHTRTYSEPPPASHELTCYDGFLEGDSALDTDGNHIRTVAGDAGGVISGDYWDWQGQGWMMGEAPLFLIDAHYDRMVCVEDGSDDGLSPRRCYFIPDSHHAIPFDFDDTNGEYVAPPRNDAYLSHNGDWDEVGDPNQGIPPHWVTRPTEFRVWLFDRTVCYTIRAIYEDVFPGILPPDDYVSATCEFTDHDSPEFYDGASGRRSRGANGIPYWGVVERIDDKFGNTIDIVYCDFVASDADIAPQGSCQACQQNCHEKGQISFVRLLSGTDYTLGSSWTSDPSEFDWDPANDEGAQDWTLVYAYRSFPWIGWTWENGGLSGAEALGYSFHRQNALHAVYVYEGDEAGTPPLAESYLKDQDQRPFTRSIHYSQFTTDQNGIVIDDGPAAIDHAESLGSAADFGLPGTWVHKLQYVYTEPFARLNLNPMKIRDVTFYGNTYSYSVPHPVDTPWLIKATRIDKDAADLPADGHQIVSLYQYDSRGMGLVELSDGVWSAETADGANYYSMSARRSWNYTTTLQNIYRDETVRRALAQLNADPNGAQWAVNDLVVGRRPGSDHAELDGELFTFDDIPDGATFSPSGADTSWERIADLSLYRWDQTADPSHSDIGGEAGCFGEASEFADAVEGFSEDLFDNYVAKAPNQSQMVVPGVFVIADRGWSGTGNRYYKLFRFRTQDSDMYRPSGKAFVPWWASDWIERSAYHAPFRVCNAVTPYPIPAPPSLTAPVWISVVEEYEDFDDARVYSTSAFPEGKVSAGEWGAGEAVRPGSRRVVEMNATGYVLFDKIWNFKDGTAEAEGIREEFKYDDDGRLIEHRTVGWGTADNPDPIQEGLVFKYAYRQLVEGENASHVPFEITDRWIQRGATHDGGGPPNRTYLLERHEYGGPRPDMPLKTTVWANPSGTETYDTDYIYVFDKDVDNDGTEDEPREWTLKSRMILGPAIPVGVGTDQGFYRPQRSEVYSYRDPDDYFPSVSDQPGVRVWNAYGLEHVSGSASHARRFYDYMYYDSMGRVLREVRDAKAGEPLHPIVDKRDGEGEPVIFQDMSASIYATYPDIDGDGADDPRIPLNGALLYERKYDYCRYGPEVVEDFDGFQKWYAYHWDVEKPTWWITREYGFKTPGNVESPGSITVTGDETGGQIWNVTWDWDDQGSLIQQLFAKLTTIEMEVDSAGRPVSAEATGWDGKAMKVEAQYDNFGGFSRETDPTGTMTRTYHDPLGRPERIFKGTRDFHSFWGYDTGLNGENTSDDLAVIEQRTYGEGTTNAYKLIESRKFRERPTQQYGQWDWDNEGFREEYLYDWRMRKVWTGTYAEGDDQALVRQQFLVLDHMDRVRFTVEYGASGPTPPDSLGEFSIGSLLVDGASDLPSAAQILAEASGSQHDLLRLSETTYNAASQVTGQFEYDVSPTHTDGSRYLATITHHDHENRPILQISPNTAPVLTEYDALGRVLTRTTLLDAEALPRFEISKTEMLSDTNGNTLATVTWERLHDMTDPTSDDPDLNAINSVGTATWSWYDNQGRVIATADLGAGSASDEFVNPQGWDPLGARSAIMGDEPPNVLEDGTVVRTANVPDDAVLHCYSYNPRGQKSVEATQIAFDGTSHTYRCETFWYDGLGNLVFWSENETAAGNSTDKRQTAYLYDKGRLVKIAAVLPGHQMIQTGGPPINIDEPPPGQTTHLGYYSPDWDATDGTLQVTLVDYNGPGFISDPLSGEMTPVGAQVWTGDGVWSHNKTLPSGVRFPDPVTGQPQNGAEPDLEFTYYVDGSIRVREDILGRSFTHAYDQFGQRISTEVGYPAGSFVAGHEPLDIADLFTFGYDDLGRLTGATAGVDDNSDGVLDDSNDTIIADNVYAYEHRGNLKTEYQSYGEMADASSRAVGYQWDYVPGSASLGADGNHDRLSQMTYPARVQNATVRTIEYSYGLGNPADSVDSTLSRISQIRDITSGSSEQLVAYLHAGANRRVYTTAWSDGGGSLAEAYRQTFDDGAAVGYTGLDRFGRTRDLNYTSPGGTPIHRYEYGYDSAGNRLYAKVTQDGQANTRSWLYGYDDLGRLRSAEQGELQIDPNNYGNSSIVQSLGTPSSRVAWGLDRLGNWTQPADGFEGRVEFEDTDGLAGYETLVLAEDHSTDLRNELDEIVRDDGSGAVSESYVYDAAGNLIADEDYFYQFDAFNRLANVHARGDLEFDGAGNITDGEPGDWRADFAYDALGRRISKQVPWHTGDARQAWYYYDGVRRVQEVFRDPLPQAGIGGNPTPGGSYVTYTDREYVWGPEYVDECLWQVDRTGAAAFVLQDANFNVVALLDYAGSVLKQYDYDPYGEVIASDSLGSYAHNRIGFQGLPVDRFDVDAPSAELAVGADTLSYARNRDYRPDLGRWVQRDSVLTGTLEVVGDLASIATTPSQPDFLTHYGDGLNTFAFVRSGPLNLTDPFGQFSFGQMGAAMGIQGMLGGLLGGTMSKIMCGSFVEGAIGGAIGGALGGGAGYAFNSAFAASASGLWGSLAAHSAVGAVDGAVSAFGQTYYTEGSLRYALADAAAGALIGAATGGLMDTPAIRNLFVPQKARSVLAHLRSHNGAPPQGYKGGRAFKNRDGKLPQGSYKEYDVDAKGSGSRNAERIVIDQNTGQAYYTPDHYETFIPMLDP